MGYFITGATGFIGGNLLKRLAGRDGDLWLLVREGSTERLLEKCQAAGLSQDRVHLVEGDLTQPRAGVSDENVAAMTGTIDHAFHLAAIYDLTASGEAQHAANVEGTRHVVELVNAIGAGRFHHVSSIAAGGTYRGEFTEDMFDEATGLDHPYFATKHESEDVARSEAQVPWRVYRPGIVVGDSTTGEIDKIDGPYYFFKLIQKLRGMLPMWLPLLGVEGRRLNVVPVDFVVAALDHIAHLDGPEWDNQAFHLVDPEPLTVGELMNVFARAAHAPQFGIRVDSRLFDMVPAAAKGLLGNLPPVKDIKRAVLGDLGIPEDTLKYVNWATTYGTERVTAALEGSGIACPRIEDYGAAIWDYWERNLDPDLFRDHSLSGAIRDRTVLITGASDGIGREVALQAAAAGGHVLLVSRTREKLEAVQAEIEEAGGRASVHPCDLSDMDDIDRMAKEIVAEHGGVDVLVNNAGRSIRRSVRLSVDRFHDYERTMQLNYFGAVKLILALLPSMMERKRGHIINVSSIGVQTNVPRFSAYVASKAALDAFSRVIASEVIDDNIHMTEIHMPLVRTNMIAPTKIYDHFPTISPEEAGEMVTSAMIDRPKKVGTGLGNFAEVAYAIAPKVVDQVLHNAYKLFPDSAAAKGDDKATGEEGKTSNEGLAFAYLLRGVHW